MTAVNRRQAEPIDPRDPCGSTDGRQFDGERSRCSHQEDAESAGGFVVVRGGKSGRAIRCGGMGRVGMGMIVLAAARVVLVSPGGMAMRVVMGKRTDGGEGDEEEAKDHEDGGKPASERNLLVPVHVQMRCN